MSSQYCSFCRTWSDSADGRCPECERPLEAAIPGELRPTMMQPIISRKQPAERAVEVSRQPCGPRELFRPRIRPPMLLLCVWDDDGEEGQKIRIYGDRFIIGRAEGDLILPHDPGISQTHAELVRERGEKRWIWKLRDLGSTNGTFVRIRNLILNHGQILIIGGTRYQFQGVAQGGDLAKLGDVGQKTLSHVPTYKPADYKPTLVRLNSAGEEAETMCIDDGEQWIGTANDCELHRAEEEDILLDGWHATIEKIQREQWVIRDNNSTNGTWSMSHEQVINDSLEFQLGEQRFLARVP